MTNQRTKQGRFAKGKSGNPAGRPKSELAALRGQLAEHGPALVDKAVELALAGDTAALKTCLDRICPPLKAQTPTVSIPVAPGAAMGDMARAFIEAASQGRITPDEASQMLTALAGATRVVETAELEARIKALEERNDQDH